MAYVNKRLKHMRPSLQLDLINHPDIQVLSLFNEEREYCLLNIYNADNNAALMHLSDCTDELPNSVIYMGGDFNIHAYLWDPTYRGPEQPEHWDLLLETAEELGLELSLPENPGSSHIPGDRTKQETVIDLIFIPSQDVLNLKPKRLTANRGRPDHVPLLIIIPINPTPEFPQG